MRRMDVIALVVLGPAVLAGPTHAAKVCMSHENRYILVNESAKQAYLARGAAESSPELCVEACVVHNNEPTIITYRSLPEHLTHGDTQLEPSQCLTERSNP